MDRTDYHLRGAKIQMVLSPREASLIQELRKYRFGKVLVHKADGELLRIEVNQSIKLDTSMLDLDPSLRIID